MQVLDVGCDARHATALQMLRHRRHLQTTENFNLHTPTNKVQTPMQWMACEGIRARSVTTHFTNCILSSRMHGVSHRVAQHHTHTHPPTRRELQSQEEHGGGLDRAFERA